MSCTACGAPLPPDARFCSACGAARPAPEAWHLSGPGGQHEGTLEEHAVRVGETSGAWHLWKTGWEGWKPWDTVPEAVQAAAALAPTPEPPEPPTLTFSGGYRPPPVPDRLREPEERWHLHGAGEQLEGPLRELRERVAKDPEVAWHLWKPGLEGWVPWAQVVG